MQAMGVVLRLARPESLTYHAPVAGMPGVDVFRAVYQRHRFARHSHDSLALGVVDAGVGEFWCRGATHRVGRDSLVLIAPGEVHTGSSTDASSPLAYRMIYVGLSLHEQLMHGASLPAFRTAAPNDHRAADAVRQAFDVLSESPYNRMERQSALVHLLGILCTRHAATDSQLNTPRRVSAALINARDIITARYNETLSLIELAREVELSPRTSTPRSPGVLACLPTRIKLSSGWIARPTCCAESGGFQPSPSSWASLTRATSTGCSSGSWA